MVVVGEVVVEFVAGAKAADLNGIVLPVGRSALLPSEPVLVSTRDVRDDRDDEPPMVNAPVSASALVNPSNPPLGALGAVPELGVEEITCLLYTSPSPRDLSTSRMPSSA